MSKDPEVVEVKPVSAPPMFTNTTYHSFPL
jgi:hypothetical protein